MLKQTSSYQSPQLNAQRVANLEFFSRLCAHHGQGLVEANYSSEDGRCSLYQMRQIKSAKNYIGLTYYTLLAKIDSSCAFEFEVRDSNRCLIDLNVVAKLRRVVKMESLIDLHLQVRPALALDAMARHISFTGRLVLPVRGGFLLCHIGRIPAAHGLQSMGNVTRVLSFHDDDELRPTQAPMMAALRDKVASVFGPQPDCNAHPVGTACEELLSALSTTEVFLRYRH